VSKPSHRLFLLKRTAFKNLLLYLDKLKLWENLFTIVILFSGRNQLHQLREAVISDNVVSTIYSLSDSRGFFFLEKKTCSTSTMNGSGSLQQQPFSELLLIRSLQFEFLSINDAKPLISPTKGIRTEQEHSTLSNTKCAIFEEALALHIKLDTAV
jgi:hypothetical protein